MKHFLLLDANKVTCGHNFLIFRIHIITLITVVVSNLAAWELILGFQKMNRKGHNDDHNNEAQWMLVILSWLPIFQFSCKTPDSFPVRNDSY